VKTGTGQIGQRFVRCLWKLRRSMHTARRTTDAIQTRRRTSHRAPRPPKGSHARWTDWCPCSSAEYSTDWLMRARTTTPSRSRPSFHPLHLYRRHDDQQRSCARARWIFFLVDPGCPLFWPTVTKANARPLLPSPRLWRAVYDKTSAWELTPRQQYSRHPDYCRRQHNGCPRLKDRYESCLHEFRNNNPAGITHDIAPAALFSGKPAQRRPCRAARTGRRVCARRLYWKGGP